MLRRTFQGWLLDGVTNLGNGDEEIIILLQEKVSDCTISMRAMLNLVWPPHPTSPLPQLLGQDLGAFFGNGT